MNPDFSKSKRLCCGEPISVGYIMSKRRNDQFTTIYEHLSSQIYAKVGETYFKKLIDGYNGGFLSYEISTLCIKRRKGMFDVFINNELVVSLMGDRDWLLVECDIPKGATYYHDKSLHFFRSDMIVIKKIWDVK